MPDDMAQTQPVTSQHDDEIEHIPLVFPTPNPQWDGRGRLMSAGIGASCFTLVGWL